MDGNCPLDATPAIPRLPIELLHEILKYTAWDPIDDNVNPYNNGILKSLSLVCQLFRQIAKPLFYHTLKLDVRSSKELYERHLNTLSATLQNNPSLARICRSAVLYSRGDLEQTLAVISHLKNVRSLEIHDVFGRVTCVGSSSVYRAAFMNMPALQSLTLVENEMRVSFLSTLMAHVDSAPPSLQRLKLCIKHFYDAYQDPDPDPKYHRSALFTSLVITGMQASPGPLLRILEWPKSLTHFEMDSDIPISQFPPIRISPLASLLSRRKETLKSIKFGYILDGYDCDTTGIHIADTSSFPVLETLTYSGWRPHQYPCGRLIFSPAHADKMFSPALHTLRLDFTCNGSEEWFKINEPEEHWIRSLLQEAVKRNATLRRIQITFKPIDPGTTHSATNVPRRVMVGDVYPWDRLDRLRREFQPYNLAVEYNEPSFSKKKWVEAIEQVRDCYCLSCDQGGNFGPGMQR
ncbi:hypothetical protein BJX99DRAFT_256722 [Aspergillus californicus]